MGFFESLGRKVGRFTHEAKRAADEDAAYACENCGERFHTEHETCPECGRSRVVERTERNEPTTPTDATDDESTHE